MLRTQAADNQNHRGQSSMMQNRSVCWLEHESWHSHTLHVHTVKKTQMSRRAKPHLKQQHVPTSIQYIYILHKH